VHICSAMVVCQTNPAICVPPGARLILLDVPERLQHDLKVGPIEEVTFVQLSATPYQFRDAVRFTNGREIRLQELSEGMRVPGTKDVFARGLFIRVRSGRAKGGVRRVTEPLEKKTIPLVERL
jgi:hypothetical protein